MNTSARERTCQACGALPGRPCLTPGGKPSRADHHARSWLATRSPKQLEAKRIHQNAQNAEMRLRRSA